MSEYIIVNDEYLAHHGVLGQKWGVRRYQNADGTRTAKGKAHEEALNAKAEKKANITSAKAAYKQSKKDLKKAYKAAKKSNTFFAVYNRTQKTRDAYDAWDKAYLDKVKAKADLAKAKGGEKAEMKSYAKSMYKTGLSGSAKDSASRELSTKMYKELETSKGKEYADRVQKKVATKAVSQFAIGATLVVGSAIANAYLASR